MLLTAVSAFALNNNRPPDRGACLTGSAGVYVELILSPALLLQPFCFAE